MSNLKKYYCSLSKSYKLIKYPIHVKILVAYKHLLFIALDQAKHSNWESRQTQENPNKYIKTINHKNILIGIIAGVSLICIR